MTTTLNRYETSTRQQPEVTAKAASTLEQKVGGRALLPFAETPEAKLKREAAPAIAALPPLEGFAHLFPATLISSELLLTEGSTADGAERLLAKLEDDSPYKKYATSQLALYYMEQNDLPRAYTMLHTIHDDAGLTVHVLSQLVIYEDTHHTNTIEPEKLGKELHDLAIQAYNREPTTENAHAIRDAVEALPDDRELMRLARAATREHPEVLPVIEPDDML